eukprot:Rhum_TRINITY_DN14425_c26_g1::Rhum_TRINITY_DN14425_c26_g1_i1::g.90192::m.90192
MNPRKMLFVLVPALLTVVWLVAVQQRLAAEELLIADAAERRKSALHARAAAQQIGVSGTPPPPPQTSDAPGAGGVATPAPVRTIFVSVASYRDDECKTTIRSLYKKAKHPERVFVGLVCQVAEGSGRDEECVPDEMAACPTDVGADAPFCAGRNIRLRQMPHTEAKGPTYARHVASLLYANETYFMMIDSHNLFVQDWDVVALRQHDACDSDRCVMSVYPMGLSKHKHENVGLEHRPHVAYLCQNALWNGAGFPGPFLGAVYGSSKAPRPQPFIGAGLLFGPGRLVLDVPFDPHLPFLFHGEEILIATRLWTHGYDLFSPGENILFHHYYREGKPRMESASTSWHMQQRKATQRVQHLLRLPDPSDPTKLAIDPATVSSSVTQESEKYGMGSARSLEDYWKFARIDIVKRDHKGTNKYWCDRYKGGPPYSDEWKTLAASMTRKTKQDA